MVTKAPVVEVAEVTRDAPCRGWEIVLRIAKEGECGYYTFPLYEAEWRKARDNPQRIADGDHGPFLIVEKPNA